MKRKTKPLKQLDETRHNQNEQNPIATTITKC